MTYDNEAIIRHAYHTAEGGVLDIAGFVGSFAEDGVINLGHAGIEYNEVGQESYRGEQLGEIVHRIAKLFPDVHAIRLARQAASADVTVTLDITPGVPHVFQAYYRISTKRPRRWTEPDSSCRRISPAHTSGS
jgi:hypothetical protein